MRDVAGNGPRSPVPSGLQRVQRDGGAEHRVAVLVEHEERHPRPAPSRAPRRRAPGWRPTGSAGAARRAKAPWRLGTARAWPSSTRASVSRMRCCRSSLTRSRRGRRQGPARPRWRRDVASRPKVADWIAAQNQFLKEEIKDGGQGCARHGRLERHRLGDREHARRGGLRAHRRVTTPGEPGAGRRGAEAARATRSSTSPATSATRTSSSPSSPPTATATGAWTCSSTTPAWASARRSARSRRRTSTSSSTPTSARSSSSTASASTCCARRAPSTATR